MVRDGERSHARSLLRMLRVPARQVLDISRAVKYSGGVCAPEVIRSYGNSGGDRDDTSPTAILGYAGPRGIGSRMGPVSGLRDPP